MAWNKTKEQLPTKPHSYCLCFSPTYPSGDPMRMRIILGQFVRLCYDVEYWRYIEDIEKEMDV